MANFDDKMLSITSGSVQQFYDEDTVVIPAGGRVTISTVYDYFRVLDLVGSGLRVIFGDNQKESKFTGAGLGVKLRYVVKRLEFYNSGISEMTITYAVALGAVSDDRLNAVGTVNVNFEAPANLTTITDVFVPAGGSAALLAADPIRREALITNIAANATVVRVGDVDVAADRGNEVGEGGTIVLTTSDAIYAYNPSGAGVYIGVSYTAG